MKKRIVVPSEKKEILEKALKDSRNEKLDLFESLVGGDGGCGQFYVKHYSQSTYVRRMQ
jgi:hypothetical protein